MIWFFYLYLIITQVCLSLAIKKKILNNGLYVSIIVIPPFALLYILASGIFWEKQVLEEEVSIFNAVALMLVYVFMVYLAAFT